MRDDAGENGKSKSWWKFADIKNFHSNIRWVLIRSHGSTDENFIRWRSIAG
jgi:hypothetical protein